MHISKSAFIYIYPLLWAFLFSPISSCKPESADKNNNSCPLTSWTNFIDFKETKNGTDFLVDLELVVAPNVSFLKSLIKSSVDTKYQYINNLIKNNRLDSVSYSQEILEEHNRIIDLICTKYDLLNSEYLSSANKELIALEINDLVNLYFDFILKIDKNKSREPNTLKEEKPKKQKEHLKKLGKNTDILLSGFDQKAIGYEVFTSINGENWKGEIDSVGNINLPVVTEPYSDIIIFFKKGKDVRNLRLKAYKENPIIFPN